MHLVGIQPTVLVGVQLLELHGEGARHIHFIYSCMGYKPAA